MRKTAILFIATILFVVINVYAQEPDIISMRHTIGFPINITNIDISQLLKILNTTFTQNPLEGMEKSREFLENITSLYPEARNIARAVDIYTNASRGYIDRSSIENIYRSINNSILRQLLGDTVSSYVSGRNVDRTTIENLLNTINNLYSNREISVDDYLKALSILRTIASSEGYRDISMAIDRSAGSSTLNEVNSIMNMLSNINNIASSINPPNIGSLPIQPSSQFALPAFSAPSIPAIPASPPSVAGETIRYIPIVVCIAIAIALGIAIYRRIGRIAIPKIWRSPISPKSFGTKLSLYPKVVEDYWRVVRVVEYRTSRRRYDWQTHREYEHEVKEYLGILGEDFSRLTKIYEVVRYGGEDDSRYRDDVDRIVKRFEKL
ncbi:hypothetical protein Igag_0869 [Ignisphaera aggregans DSM 17230]|uniref:Protein-glutamine gamma-glutamyltransferase-like C-terminal domain-containing protein n=1 Tax=Ignisphaera aggregans (strain DSM 17230 / JCM 13409 / AQ1.S1) TaxID=583356 RepID=E0STS0_IGNAA|nr:hypothetical protein Igag_0869 [Ignisphaera aggregans DSM 17230]